MVNNDQTTLPLPSGSFHHYLTPGVSKATGVHGSFGLGLSSQAQHGVAKYNRKVVKRRSSALKDRRCLMRDGIC